MSSSKWGDKEISFWSNLGNLDMRMMLCTESSKRENKKGENGEMPTTGAETIEFSLIYFHLFPYYT